MSRPECTGTLVRLSGWRMMWWLPLILATTNHTFSRAPTTWLPRTAGTGASGDVADGDRQLIRNDEFREPAV